MNKNKKVILSKSTAAVSQHNFSPKEKKSKVVTSFIQN